jgi:hypothetical protein
MSTIAVNAITDANAGNTTTINGVTPNSANVVGKNLIINGAMQIAQRGTSVTGQTTSGYKTCDRWAVVASSLNSNAFSCSQDSDAPAGFANSFKVEADTQLSLNSNSIFYVRQIIESQNLQHLAYGSASPKTITVSFWVKSNVVGDYTCSLFRADGSRTTGKAYSITSSNTWEYKTLTFVGDTSDPMGNDAEFGMHIAHFLATGTDQKSGTFTDGTWQNYNINNYATPNQVNFFNSSSNYWQITGVQLEVGESATEFEHRPYTTELALCERYYRRTGVIRFLTMGRFNQSTGQVYDWWVLSPAMRASPTATTDGNFKATSGYTGDLLVTLTDLKGIRLVSTNNASASQILYANEGELFIDAEL